MWKQLPGNWSHIPAKPSNKKRTAEQQTQTSVNSRIRQTPPQAPQYISCYQSRHSRNLISIFSHSTIGARVLSIYKFILPHKKIVVWATYFDLSFIFRFLCVFWIRLFINWLWRIVFICCVVTEIMSLFSLFIARNVMPKDNIALDIVPWLR
jgi:hypothetical protein